MNNATKVLTNENLFNSIISYLSITDMINFSSVNKKSYQFTNKRWNEIVKNYYTSSYEEYSILITPKQDIIKEKNDYSNSDNNNSLLSINWKNFYKCGKQIQFLWTQINSDTVPMISQNSVSTKNKIFSILKGIFLIKKIIQNFYFYLNKNKFLKNLFNEI